MNTTSLRQSEKDINRSNTDGAGTRDVQNATAPGARTGCHQKHTATRKLKG